MRYELFAWETQVSEAPLWELVKLEDWSQENARIKEAFMEVFLSGESEEAITRYVQAHQTGLYHLFEDFGRLEGAGGAEDPTGADGAEDPTGADGPKDTTRADGRRVAGDLRLLLEDLCLFLERYCMKYLSQDAPIPPWRSRQLLEIIQSRMPLVKDHLSASGTEPTLMALIEDLLEGAAHQTELTYRQWYPLRDLMQFIQHLPPVEKDGVLVRDGLVISDRLIELLCYLNINTPLVFQHTMHRIQQEVEGKEYLVEQLPELGRVQRYIRLLKQKPEYRYMESRGSLVDMLEEWVTDFSKIKQLQAQTSEEQVPAKEDGGFGLDSTKVITSLTVNELGLLIRLFIDVGVFKARNLKGLSRFMAQNVVTLKKEANDQVSSNHLYGTFYSVGDATLDSVQSILNRMGARLNKLRVEQRKKVGNQKK
jgi:hypothetical protein